MQFSFFNVGGVNMKIVVIGGSIVNGFPVKDKDSWMSLWTGASKNEIINKGVNGNVAEDILNRFYDDVISEKPDSAVILFGTKDIATKGEEVDYVFTQLQEMVNRCLQNDIKPIVATPLLIDIPQACKVMAGDACIDYETGNKKLHQYREMILEASKKQGFDVLDLQGEFEKAITGKDTAQFYADGLKLNAKGHKLIATILEASNLA
jgi:lysophospholipase L1-like esterase